VIAARRESQVETGRRGSATAGSSCCCSAKAGSSGKASTQLGGAAEQAIIETEKIIAAADDERWWSVTAIRVGLWPTRRWAVAPCRLSRSRYRQSLSDTGAAPL